MFLKHDEYTDAELPARLIIDTVLCATHLKSVFTVPFFKCPLI